MTDPYRILPSKGGAPGANGSGPGCTVLLDDYLDFLQLRREVLIQELRHVDTQLVKHGRLRHHTLAKRIR